MPLLVRSGLLRVEHSNQPGDEKEKGPIHILWHFIKCFKSLINKVFKASNTSRRANILDVIVKEMCIKNFPSLNVRAFLLEFADSEVK